MQGTVEILETSGVAAIAVPAQPEIHLAGSTHQMEADFPQREVTIAIKENDVIPETAVENGETSITNGNGKLCI